ncbi:hypothetical protein CDL12_29860 [Handroanthus impetiginosus]|uniref:Uncharacterized protein n=1 Tax=Handroanthus impetiginosus TaxID=429701 RepID=A0A2G9FX86_9LAMI|nr:hypothetical protein CDL12_29860 [Handroanthus impetiginosus]
MPCRKRWSQTWLIQGIGRSRFLHYLMSYASWLRYETPFLFWPQIHIRVCVCCLL